MDISEALLALRAAFPRVTWTATEDEPGDFNIHGGPLFLWSTMGHWYCNNAVKGDPVSAVRAWLAAQPTAAFYPAPPSGETVGVRGALVRYTSGAYGLAGFSDPECGERSPLQVAHELASGDAKAGGAWVQHSIVIRVPLPVEPPVLVGEVSDV